MARKKAAWLRELHNKNSFYQCLNCAQRHAGTCDPEPHSPVRVSRPSVPIPQEQTSPRTIIPNPTSWLTASLRRHRSTADDVEASAASPNESTCLITPLTDDERCAEGSQQGYGAMEQSIPHLEDSEAVVKKKGRKGSKKDIGESSTEAEGKRKEILDQVAVYEQRLP
jgi:hypothetical protein